MSYFENYAKLDFGTRPASPISTETVEVKVGTAELSGRYVRALFAAIVDKANAVRKELATTRRPEWQKCPLTEENIARYLNYLLDRRCAFVKGDCSEWRKLRALWIPSYWQFVLAMIGEYRNRRRGLRFIPVIAQPTDMTFEEALALSEQLSEFEGVLHMERAAMPTDTKGDEAVMTSVIIADRVRSISDDVHPAFQYVVAMADMKLQQETAFAALYRIQYDDVQNLVIQATMSELT